VGQAPARPLDARVDHPYPDQDQSIPSLGLYQARGGRVAQRRTPEDGQRPADPVRVLPAQQPPRQLRLLRQNGDYKVLGDQIGTQRFDPLADFAAT
jgi:hypothetical protein